MRCSRSLGEAAESLFGEGDALITRERHRLALNEACEALRRGCRQAETELFAEDMRLAARAIGRISGRVDVEDVLDQLFFVFLYREMRLACPRPARR